MRILAFEESLPQARTLAAALDMPCDTVEVHTFPDGESLVRLPESLPERIILFRGLDHPNAKLIELLLAARTARRLGVKRILLVAPYLCYMRQDIEFLPGQAVSQPIIGQYLAELCDVLITVDPHLHRITHLREAVPLEQAVSLSAAPLIGRFVCAQRERPLLVGPDEESEQWVREAAKPGGCDYVVARKRRDSDTEVSVTLPEYDYRGRHAVLVDDMVSTGHTLMRTAEQLLARGAASVDAAFTHALCDEDSVRRLHDSGIGACWSTDSIAHPSNRIPLAELLADAVRRVMM